MFSFLVPSMNMNGLNYILLAKGTYTYLVLYDLKLAHSLLRSPFYNWRCALRKYQ